MSDFDVIDEFGLKYMQGRFLVSLARAGRLDKSDLSNLKFVSGIAETSVCNIVADLRKLLRHRGVKITTVHGVGYELDAESRAIVLEILNRRSPQDGCN